MMIITHQNEWRHLIFKRMIDYRVIYLIMLLCIFSSCKAENDGKKDIIGIGNQLHAQLNELDTIIFLLHIRPGDTVLTPNNFDSTDTKQIISKLYDKYILLDSLPKFLSNAIKSQKPKRVLIYLTDSIKIDSEKKVKIIIYNYMEEGNILIPLTLGGQAMLERIGNIPWKVDVMTENLRWNLNKEIYVKSVDAYIYLLDSNHLEAIDKYKEVVNIINNECINSDDFDYKAYFLADTNLKSLLVYNYYLIGLQYFNLLRNERDDLLKIKQYEDSCEFYFNRSIEINPYFIFSHGYLTRLFNERIDYSLLQRLNGMIINGQFLNRTEEANLNEHLRYIKKMKFHYDVFDSLYNKNAADSITNESSLYRNVMLLFDSRKLTELKKSLDLINKILIDSKIII